MSKTRATNPVPFLFVTQEKSSGMFAAEETGEALSEESTAGKAGKRSSSNKAAWCRITLTF